MSDKVELFWDNVIETFGRDVSNETHPMYQTFKLFLEMRKESDTDTESEEESDSDTESEEESDSDTESEEESDSDSESEEESDSDSEEEETKEEPKEEPKKDPNEPVYKLYEEEFRIGDEVLYGRTLGKIVKINKCSVSWAEYNISHVVSSNPRAYQSQGFEELKYYYDKSSLKKVKPIRKFLKPQFDTDTEYKYQLKDWGN